MKRISVIIFSLFYLIASVGIAINVHYCGGQISNIDLSSNNSMCCCEDMDEMSNCCDDEKILFQLDDDQKLSQSTRTSFDQTFTLIVLSSYLELLPQEENKNVLNSVTDPPIIYEQPAWLRNCSLVYYG